jgi:hypothetical protein
MGFGLSVAAGSYAAHAGESCPEFITNWRRWRQRRVTSSAQDAQGRRPCRSHFTGRGRSPEAKGTVGQRFRVRTLFVYSPARGLRSCLRTATRAGGVGIGYLGSGECGFESRGTRHGSTWSKRQDVRKTLLPIVPRRGCFAGATGSRIRVGFIEVFVSIGCRLQGLKPLLSIRTICGPTEVVPCYKAFTAEFFTGL